MDDDFGHWLAGFIDGEGCFSVARRGHTPNAWSTRFHLAVRIDDQPIIEQIEAITGIGHTDVYKGSHNPMARWYAVSKADCLELTHLLDRYPLRAKKAGDYQWWRKAVLEWNGDRDWEKIAHFAHELVKGRQIAILPTVGCIPTTNESS